MKKIILLLLVLPISIQSQFWVEQNSGVTVSLNSVVNSNWQGAGWICGDNGTVLRTANDGINWINISGNGIPNDVDLTIISDCGNFNNYAITAGKRGDTAIVYRTTNNGASWQVVFSQFGGKINGISLGFSIGALYGFMAGDPVGGRWSIWKTTNYGLNWDSTGMFIPQNNSETGFSNSFIYSGSHLFFGTNNSRLYYSSNEGVSWTFNTVSGMTNIVSIDLVGYTNPFTGYVGGVNKILWTTNSGANWAADTVMPGNGSVVGLHKQPIGVDALGNQNLIAVKNNDKIYWQGQHTSPWMLHFTAPAGNYTHVATKSYDRVWAIRDNGGITFCGCHISGINNNEGSIPEIFSLHQNYPNPFNPVTNIKFDLPRSSLVKLIIYNVLGKEIAILVHQQMQAGSYSTHWDASAYPSGVYFYKIETENFAETKKMILLK